MKIVKLEVDLDEEHKHLSYRCFPFYFHNDSDCDDFIQVFKDHFCNVPWKKTHLIFDLSTYPKERLNMDKDPKERAEENLSWGFVLADDIHGRGYLTEDQRSFVNGIMNKLNKED